MQCKKEIIYKDKKNMTSADDFSKFIDVLQVVLAAAVLLFVLGMFLRICATNTLVKSKTLDNYLLVVVLYLSLFLVKALARMIDDKKYKLASSISDIFAFGFCTIAIVILLWFFVNKLSGNDNINQAIKGRIACFHYLMTIILFALFVREAIGVAEIASDDTANDWADYIKFGAHLIVLLGYDVLLITLRSVLKEYLQEVHEKLGNLLAAVIALMVLVTISYSINKIFKYVYPNDTGVQHSLCRFIDSFIFLIPVIVGNWYSRAMNMNDPALMSNQTDSEGGSP